MSYKGAPSLPYSKLGNVEDGTTASKAYNQNDYIIWMGDNYFAKTDILQGETFVVDTNLTAIPDGVINGIVARVDNLSDHLAQVDVASSVTLQYNNGGNGIVKNICTYMDSLLVFVISGYTGGTQVSGDNKHFFTIDSSLLARIPASMNIPGFAWPSSGAPHAVWLVKDDTGFALYDRNGNTQYYMFNFCINLLPAST